MHLDFAGQSSVRPLHWQLLLGHSHREQIPLRYCQAVDMLCSTCRCMSQSVGVRSNKKLVRWELLEDKLRSARPPHIRFQDPPANHNSANVQRTILLCCVNLCWVAVPLLLHQTLTQILRNLLHPRNLRPNGSSRFFPCHNPLMYGSDPISA